MKNIILHLLFICIFAHLHIGTLAQSVAINTDGSIANGSSILDVKSTTKGLLIPRMLLAERNLIASPATGLLIYQTDNTAGYYYYNGSGWVPMSGGGASNYWSLNGSNIFNNNAGNVGIGTTTPGNKLHVFKGSAGAVTGWSQAPLIVEGSTDNYINILAPDAAATGILFGKPANNISGGILYNNIPANNPNGFDFRTNGNVTRMVLTGIGNLGIGTITPDNTLHVFKGSAGDVTGYSGAPLIVENLTHSYINILAPDDKETGILFGKPASNVSGGIIYNSPGTLNGLQFRTNGNLSRMVLTDAGNLGVGVFDPLFKMDIADRIRIRSGAAGSAGISLNNPTNSATIAFMGTKDVDLTGIYGTNSGWGLLMNTNTGAVSIGSQNPVAGYKLSVQGNQYVNGLIATTGDAEIGGAADVSGNLFVGGKIGIGGTAFVPLEVFSYVNYNRLQSWTYYDNCNPDCFTLSELCIKANGDVQAQIFVSTSDARIKNIIGVSNSAKDLETINALQITDYTMKDRAMYGNKAFKKVVAQQVEEVYPQVVSANVGYIPNVYAVPSKIEKTTNGFLGSLLSFTNKHNLSKDARKIQLMIGREIKEFDIVDIPSENQVAINATDLKTDKVFVYGEQINDSRNVDYDGLVTLNISATQELSKIIKTQQQQIDLLLKRIEALEKK